jgi:hypothetical protein
VQVILNPLFYFVMTSTTCSYLRLLCWRTPRSCAISQVDMNDRHNYVHFAEGWAYFKLTNTVHDKDDTWVVQAKQSMNTTSLIAERCIQYHKREGRAQFGHDYQQNHAYSYMKKLFTKSTFRANSHVSRSEGQISLSREISTPVGDAHDQTCAHS